MIQGAIAISGLVQYIYEEGMATHSSILAWRIPYTEEPGGLQSMGSQRIGHDRVAKQSTIYLCTESEVTYSESLDISAWMTEPRSTVWSNF